MLVTTWDGHLRLDRVAGGAVLLTLLTGEPTTEAALRAGLLAAFVTADPDGPPARVRTLLDGDRLPGDIAVLVGPRIADVVAGLAGEAWLRLDLAEVDVLAESWAPYRRRVLAPSPDRSAVGSWADGLWTVFDIDWRGLVPVFRSGSASGSDLAGGWPVPVEIVRAVRCAPTLLWRARPVEGGGVELDVEIEPEPGGGPVGVRADLWIAPDRPDAKWVLLRADQDGSLRARLALPGPDSPALRLRALTREDS